MNKGLGVVDKKNTLNTGNTILLVEIINYDCIYRTFISLLLRVLSRSINYSFIKLNLISVSKLNFDSHSQKD